MPYSIIDSRFPVHDDLCVFSLVHDVNAERQDYANAFIVIESSDLEGHYAINKYALSVENGVATMGHMNTDSIEYFKKAMAEKDCYAVSFHISIKDASKLMESLVTENEKLAKKRYSKEVKPSFLSESRNSDNYGINTSFDWARSKAGEVIQDKSRSLEIMRTIPGGIKFFINSAVHIGNLVPETSRCLMM